MGVITGDVAFVLLCIALFGLFLVAVLAFGEV
jgi:hypothetical protein